MKAKGPLAKAGTVKRNHAIGIVVATVVLSIALLFSSVRAVLQTPWIGVSLAPAPSGDGLVVKEIIDGRAHTELAVGDVLVAIHGGAQPTPLDTEIIVPLPFRVATWSVADYRAFLDTQGRLSRALSQPAVTVIKSNGQSVTVETGTRSVSQVPFELWYYLTCGVLALIFGLAVFLRFREELAVRYYLIAGVSYFITASLKSVYLVRPLAIDGDLFHGLIVSAHFTTGAFVASMLAILWTYPTRLRPHWLPWLFYAVYFCFWLTEALQLIDSLVLTFYSPLFYAFSLAIVVAGMQWKATRWLPADRAVLRWIFLVIFISSGLILFAAIGPRILGGKGLLTTALEAYVILFMYLSIAVALTRYRVVNLEWWWSNLGACYAMLSIVALVYVVLIQVFGQENFTAAVAAVLAGGWTFFPIRNLLRSRWRARPHHSLEQHVQELLEYVFSSRTTALMSAKWEAFLQRLFDPLLFTVRRERSEVATVTHDGVILRVPDVDESVTLELAYSHRGGRMFALDDARVAQNMLNLLRRANALRTRQEESVERERSRIARDLHDDVGARVLTMIHRGSMNGIAELGRAALRELRETISGLDGSAQPLAAVLADLRAEIAERAEAAGVEFEWRQPAKPPELAVGSRERVNLRRVVREAVSNALRHGAPVRLEVDIQFHLGRLRLLVVDDGVGSDVAHWRQGRGTRNMRARMREIGGDVTWRSRQPHGCRVEIGLPLKDHVA